jgi:hypothetical protein
MPEVDRGRFFGRICSGWVCKHGLNQWLPGGFDASGRPLSTGRLYQTDLRTFNLDLMPEEGSDIYNPYEGQPQIWEDNHIDMVADRIHRKSVGWQTLADLMSVYGGVGFQTSSLSIKSPGCISDYQL